MYKKKAKTLVIGNKLIIKAMPLQENPLSSNHMPVRTISLPPTITWYVFEDADARRRGLLQNHPLPRKKPQRRALPIRPERSRILRVDRTGHEQESRFSNGGLRLHQSGQSEEQFEVA